MKNNKYYRKQNPVFPLGTSVNYNENKLPFSGKPIDVGSKLTRVVMDLKTSKPLKIGELKLSQKIGGKGEGTAYKCNIQDKVCKIYHPNNITNFRLMKLLEMQRRKIKIKGVCWPEEILYYNKHFVGYLMNEAKGYELQTSVMNPMVIRDKFPQWERKELVSLCLSILRIVKELHLSNIIIGDLNATNILVNNFNNIYFIDCDSFQIMDYPCPVGTPYFTPREIQEKKYSTFLRTKEHDMFAVTTLMFMILFLGKPPYSCKGGGSPVENIKNGNFPYKFNDRRGDDTPDGPWKFIWNNLPRKLKEIFEDCFAKNQRPTIKELERVLVEYSIMLEKKFGGSNELLPTKNKVVPKHILDKYKNK
ncbi:protein kinase domain-containing protein [Brachyspira pulli]|uniref:protein kinase domain-containing protein n=1 Tax=Brachyspira pulli TaxID=310721 RepID=UPI0030064C4C